MAITHVRLERINPNASDAEVLRWHVRDGDLVEEGADLLDVETDKAVVTIEASQRGYVRQLSPAGNRVLTGACVALIAASLEEFKAHDGIRVGARVGASESEQTQDARDTTATVGARQLAAHHGIDLRQIRKAGIITKRDVESHLAGQSHVIPPGPRVGASDASDALDDGRRIKRSYEPSHVQRRMIDRMTRSRNECIPAVVHAECGAQRMVRFIADQRREGTMYALSDLLTWYLGRAIARFELVNACFDAGKVVVFDEVNLGSMVDHDGQLYMLTVRAVDQMTLADVTTERRRVILDLMRGKPALRDVTGATFALSVLDQPGICSQVPVIPLGLGAIVGVGALMDTPGSDPHGYKRLQSTLVYDHRVFSGQYAAQFMSHLTRELETLTGLQS